MIQLKCKNFNWFSENLSKNFFESKEQIKDILEKLVDDYEKTINYGYMECTCGCDDLIFYGSYTRNIGVFGNYIKINVKRVRCKKCNKTHSLIPYFILPKFQNDYIYILNVIKNIFIKKKSINKISRLLNQDRQLISFWLKRFNTHLSRIISVLKTTKRELIIDKCLKENVNFIINYKLLNAIYFLQKVPT